MSSTRSSRKRARETAERNSSASDADGLISRLGLDQPAGWWPTAPRLKSFEAAGFTHIQVRMPPRALLEDTDLTRTHATALRHNLQLTGLRLILHAPDDLLAGRAKHDRQLEGALDYASIAGGGILVYHGANVRLGTRGFSQRLSDEQQSLRRLVPRASELGIKIAIENLAPVYPGREAASHKPTAVAELVDALASEQVGMCLDLGHAHIAAELAGCDLAELIEPVLERVIIFHVHDNFGARPNTPRPGGHEPVRLDLHLPPGAGTLPWAAIGPMLSTHDAPLQLEIHPAGRPEPATLAVLTREVLRRSSGARAG
jgi:sugar phosphate isomerase/epimerase